MPALTLALNAPTVRYEPLGDVATTTGVPVEVSLEALRLCNLAADRRIISTSRTSRSGQATKGLG